MVGLSATIVVLIGAASFLVMAKMTQHAGPEAALTVTGALLVFVMTDIVVVALLTAAILQWLLARATHPRRDHALPTARCQNPKPTRPNRPDL